MSIIRSILSLHIILWHLAHPAALYYHRAPHFPSRFSSPYAACCACQLPRNSFHDLNTSIQLPSVPAYPKFSLLSGSFCRADCAGSWTLTNWMMTL
ncbi:hypothetical protein C8R45DRAFT_991196 [Mycena sanguinolenta]|nr:hypothetical protein C8R45DRAFT_991196 [Mycena sanguinolenta]